MSKYKLSDGEERLNIFVYEQRSKVCTIRENDYEHLWKGKVVPSG